MPPVVTVMCHVLTCVEASLCCVSPARLEDLVVLRLSTLKMWKMQLMYVSTCLCRTHFVSYAFYFRQRSIATDSK